MGDMEEMGGVEDIGYMGEMDEMDEMDEMGEMDGMEEMGVTVEMGEMGEIRVTCGGECAFPFWAKLNLERKDTIGRGSIYSNLSHLFVILVSLAP
jgi:hypothetical protein